MKLVLKGFFSLVLLLSASALAADCASSCDSNNGCAPTTTVCAQSCPDSCGDVYGKTFFSARPQDSNVARRMVGVIDKTHPYGKEEFFGTVSLALQYQQTFHDRDLSRFFSFNPDSAVMTYGPTCGAFDIYSLNFGTTATNGVANATSGLAAATSTTGNGVCLQPRIKNFIAEFDVVTGWDEFVCGLWTRLTLPVVHTKYNMQLNDLGGVAAATGDYPTNLVTCGTDTGTPVAFSNLADAWNTLGAFGSVPAGRYGALGSCAKRSKTALAGLHLEVGYDFYRCERGFLGIGAHVVAPTGTRPEARLLFEPIAGANHSWQLGGTIQAGYQLWQNCDGNQSVALYFDSIITHLFGSRQRRLFGLKVNGVPSAGAEYLLLKRFNADGTALAADCLERASNLLALESKIKADVMADLALMLQYDKCNWSTAIGWNFWLRSKEKLQGDLCSNPFVGGDFRYAIKGDTLANNTDTQSNATIGSCGTTDATPVFLTAADVDVCAALNPRAFSNKVFGFVGYNWKDCEWMPYLLVEGEAEFGHDNTAVNQWGVMLKGGVSF
jgi:hypothetical protein